MIRRLLVIAVLASTVHCNRENALESPVTHHCSELAAEIDQMAEDYEARSKIADESLSPDQLRTADTKYGIIPYDRRFVVGGHLARELAFCDVVRNEDEQARSALEKRAALAFKAFADGNKLGDAAKALRDLSTVAAEVSHLPLK
jgi:hypothetical protein